MAVKAFDVQGIGQISVCKRKGARSLRIRIAADGAIRVTIPYLTPYATGVTFARSRSQWILENLPQKRQHITSGQRVGKAHRIKFLNDTIEVPISRIVGSEIRITKPAKMAVHAAPVQKVAELAAVRALRLQASKLLPGRLRSLAERQGFKYADVRVKQLKGRWGSCDHKQRIVLNLYLMQLPWELIDYVLLHELIHTKHMNHSSAFWEEFLRHEPKAKQLRSMIKDCRPILLPVSDGQPM